jgi:hypothetical protein
MILQRLYSRKDYEGLTEEGRAILKEKRDSLAKKYIDSLKELNSKTEQTIKDAEAVYDLSTDAGKKKYNKAVDKIRKNHNKELEDLSKALEGEKFKASSSVPYSRKPAANSSDNKAFADSFKEKTKDLKDATKKTTEGFFKKNKKGLIIGGSVLAASGVAYGGVKVVKKYKDKKKSEDIRKKVSGYDNSKKKKS